MKALVLRDINNLTIENVDRPIPSKGEVLIKVKACGICGSDIPRAFRDGAHNMPLIIGHEFSGEVEEVGEGVDLEWLGKRVGIFPLIPCKKCPECAKKHYEMCQNYSYLGSRRDGGFSEYVTVPAWNLIAIPSTVSFEQAAMLEPMAVAIHAIRRVKPKISDTIVVLGLGTIGMLILMFLRELGIKNILAIGNKEYQREKAIAFGLSADNYCDSNMWVVKDWLEKKTGGVFADIVFECVGKEETYRGAIDYAGSLGKVCLVGNPNSDMSIDKATYWKILRKQLIVTGTWNSSFTWDRDDDWHYVISVLASGRIEPERIITQKYMLEEIKVGFDQINQKKTENIKVMAIMKDR